MIGERSIINVADNSGAQKLMMIQVLGRSNARIARLGDVVNCVVKKADPLSVIKDGSIVKAVIVRTKKTKQRKDGSWIRFDDNAGVLIDNLKDKKPKATRIFGPVARELKDLGFDKIISMAQEAY